MSVLTELKEYLVEKLERTNINNPKANRGAVLLKLNEEWEDKFDDIIDEVTEIMQRLFSKETADSLSGETPLTNLSMKIGAHMFRTLDRESMSWKDELKMGDLIIEAFYNCGFINIDYPARRDSSHVVAVSVRWPEIARRPRNLGLRDTVFDKIPDIRGPKQAEGRLVVKNRPDFPVDVNTPWVRSVNKLQQTPWRINKRVWDTVVKNDGFVSSKKEKLKIKELKRLSKIIEWDFIKRKVKEALEDGRDFYQYMSLDYRGRIYNEEPFLNFQGSDISKGILLFAEGKPLTERGLDWLAVHTANSYNQSYDIDKIPEWCGEDYHIYLEEQKLESISVDKMTLRDRYEWTMRNMEKILDHGEFLTVDQDAEKVVAFLAACVEWYDYSENEDHISHLPIPIDGSNNGWQHLGAISKDIATGELVGLVPVTIQKDFYVQTAKELINQTTDERLSAILDEMKMKEIRKGISKRGSMTRAYSAGAAKIADNMYLDCRVEDYIYKYNIDKKDCNKLARILIRAINVVCPGPLDTMGYLQDLAAFEIGKNGIDPTLLSRKKELVRLPSPTDEELDELDELVKTIEEQGTQTIYGNGQDQICWETPTGFQVTYNNYQMDNLREQGTISGYRRVRHVVRMANDRPDFKGFMCGISPNFIHSMDASHMAMVIDEWDHMFGAVHDSFSTHACDVDKLLALTKSKFIEMYDVDNFYDYIEDQLITNKTDLDVDQPDRGSLKIREIEDSDYFFA